MKIRTHKIDNTEIAEVISDNVIIRNTEDALDLLGNVWYQGFDRMIIRQENIIPDFFDLKNKLAGDILQKFSNYRVRLAIVGDFSELPGKSLRDFIFESNKGKAVSFVASVSEALSVLV